MKNNIILSFLLLLPFTLLAGSEENIGFENGLEGWKCYQSKISYIDNFSIYDNTVWKNPPVPIEQTLDEYPQRFLVFSNSNQNQFDGCGVLSLITNMGNKFLRLGNADIHSECEKVSYTFIYDSSKKLIKYGYALVLEETNSYHESFERPSFIASVMITREGNVIETDLCVSKRYYGDSLRFSDLSVCKEYENPITGWTDDDVLSKNWAYNLIDLETIGAQPGDSVTLSFATFDCTQGGHFGYAYVDAEFVNSNFEIAGVSSNKVCMGETQKFSYPGARTFVGERYTWKVDDVPVSENSEDPTLNYVFTTAGKHKISLNIDVNGADESSCQSHQTITDFVEVIICSETACNDCPSKFSPKPGEKYVVGGWVNAPAQLKNPETASFTGVYIEIRYSDGTSVQCYPKGNIIDGWQRISETIVIPEDASKMTIALKNNSGAKAYFDDIRFHPFNATMKSYVYDPETLRLSAELDDENYATFYDYDEEGALVRVRKETERGVMTIQEARQSTYKTK